MRPKAVGVGRERFTDLHLANVVPSTARTRGALPNLLSIHPHASPLSGACRPNCEMLVQVGWLSMVVWRRF